MSQHVESIAENLYALTARKMKPLVIVVDDDNHYISHHGELTDYQLPGFEPGNSCIEALPFLVGLENEPYISLPIMSFNDNNITSINIIKINLYRYIVLLEAKEEHKRQQRATQDSNETKLLYQKLQQLTQQLEVANNAKSRFISNMSHEFRTPISSILGYSDILAQNSSLNTEEGQHAKAINRNAKYLLSLIDNVLEHAQLESDKLLVNIAPFLLNELVVTIGVMFGSQAEDSKIEFNIKTSECLPDAIYSDQIRLQQILINLIGNAFKYTDQGSVTVSFDWIDEELVITVADTGPGISKEHQPNIFDAYSRYNVGGKKGAGLGLNISAQLAEKLRGNLVLKSQFGEGSTFILTIKAPIANADDIVIGPKSSNDTVKSVLVVEDDEDLIELLKIYLGEYGYNTHTVENGEMAIQKCKSENFDLVLLDMQLPELSGIDVVKSLRKTHVDLPIIGMTASSNNEDKIKALDAGCNEFLSKPIQPASLANAINNFFS